MEKTQHKSTYSKQFEKHRIDPWFSQYLCNRKDIEITGTFGTFTSSGTRFTNIFCGRAIHSPSPSHESSSESVTPKGNPTPCNNPPKLVLNIPPDPYLDLSLSDFSLLNPSDLSDNDYYKQILCSKKNWNKF